jgi:hypothetical protein
MDANTGSYEQGAGGSDTPLSETQSIGVDGEGDKNSKRSQKASYENYPEDEIDRQIRDFFEWIKKKDPKLTDWILAATSIALAIVGLSQLAVAWMNYRDTSPLLGYAQKTSEAAQKFSDSAKKINQGIGDAVISLNDQKGQQERLATATETANNNVLSADRPWFGAVLSVDSFEVGKIPVGTIIFVNSGKRPAKVTLTEAMTHWFNAFPVHPPYEFDTTPSVSVVIPNGTVISKFNLLKTPLSQQEMDASNRGIEASFFVYSNIEFSDIRTGKPHFAHFCWRYIGNVAVIAKGFYGCREYSETDNNN